MPCSVRMSFPSEEEMDGNRESEKVMDKFRNFRQFFTASSENMTFREIVSDLDISVADFNGTNGFSEKHLHSKHPCLTHIFFESTNRFSFLIKSRLHPLATIIFNN